MSALSSVTFLPVCYYQYAHSAVTGCLVKTLSSPVSGTHTPQALLLPVSVQLTDSRIDPELPGNVDGFQVLCAGARHAAGAQDLSEALHMGSIPEDDRLRRVADPGAGRGPALVPHRSARDRGVTYTLHCAA